MQLSQGAGRLPKVAEHSGALRKQSTPLSIQGAIGNHSGNHWELSSSTSHAAHKGGGKTGGSQEYLGTLRQHFGTFGNIKGTLDTIQGTFREHSGNINLCRLCYFAKGAGRKGNIGEHLGIFREQSTTFREHSTQFREHLSSPSQAAPEGGGKTERLLENV
jgi:hypothetical protein